jgi:REP element-mobilizing transposase RayT
MDNQDLSKLAEEIEAAIEKRKREPEQSNKPQSSFQSQREQSGFFHIWFRGCNRYNVFYDYEDFTHFLISCSSAAEKHKTAITAFVLMDNHVHLQLYTNTLSLFMTSLLISFNRWYNKRWEMNGRVFGSPFSSCALYSRDALENNYLYILTNPVRAGICKKAEDYKWSSYHFMKKGYYNPLSTFIGLEMFVSNYLFNNTKDLQNRINHYLHDSYDLSEDFGDIPDKSDKSKKDHNSSNDTNHNESRVSSETEAKSIDPCKVDNTNSTGKRCKKQNFTVRPTDNEIASHYIYLLNGRNAEQIEKKEFIKIIKLLRHQSHATYRQISSVTHQSYAYILRLLKSNG